MAETEFNPEPESPRVAQRREIVTFIFLAFVIWPFIAVGVVGAYGLAVWIYYMFTGPPGPV